MWLYRTANLLFAAYAAFCAVMFAAQPGSRYDDLFWILVFLAVVLVAKACLLRRWIMGE